MLFHHFLDDHSRVILEQQDGNQHSDYINASYIGVSLPRAILKDIMTKLKKCHY